MENMKDLSKKVKLLKAQLRQVEGYKETTYWEIDWKEERSGSLKIEIEDIKNKLELLDSHPIISLHKGLK